MSLEPHETSTTGSGNDDYLLIRSNIIKWWRMNNITTPIECKHKIIKSDRGNELTKLLLAPDIKSFPCQGNTTAIRHYVKGQFREDIIKGGLEGKGKLIFISENEWSKLSRSDQKRKMLMSMTRLMVCFKALDSQGRYIKEIIGTFKNGSVHGLTKVTYTDGSFHIGNYRYGKLLGFSRTFDSEKNLLDAGRYYDGWEAGYHWKHRFGHLLYQKMERVNAIVSPTLVFPIAANGVLMDPIAGDYFPYSATLTNIHKLGSISITSSMSHCMLDIDYELVNIENYTYSLSTKIKYPLFGQKEYKMLCNRTQAYGPGNVARRLKNWIGYITYLLENRSIQPDINVSRAPEILFLLKPELEQLDVAKSTKLISDITFCKESKSMKARILGSPPVKFQFGRGHCNLDEDLRLNGFNQINVAAEGQQYLPKDKTLGWVPISIAGSFEHGVLNGLVLIATNVSTNVWATVKSGILHGPCVVSGISYIMDVVRVN